MRAPSSLNRRAIALLSGGLIIIAVTVVGVGVAALYVLARNHNSTTQYAPPQAASSTPGGLTGKPPSNSDGADGLFLSTLATYGISDNGMATQRQRYMEFGHHSCFSLLPPNPQPMDSVVNSITAAVAQDVDLGHPWVRQFTHEDSEHLVQAAIGAYCPEAPH
jgi:hypothetical protein